ncbi:MAG: beta-ketoacyl synthase N-terminal-like domain-containing protein [Bacteroidota bacterium]
MSAAVITAYEAQCCLGSSVEETWRSLRQGRVGLRPERVAGNYTCPVGRIPTTAQEPPFSSLVHQTLQTSPLNWEWASSRTAWILCSAKGNVNALASGTGAYSLSETANTLAQELGMAQSPTNISTACTSSLAGIVLALRLLKGGRYDKIAVTGCDLASDFVLSGFNRIKAISSAPCRPYDATRNGINLATAAASIFLEWRKPRIGEVAVVEGNTSNDGFHISRPIPDGAGLASCIQRTCQEYVPDFICGHGTATILNDNMESEAIARSGMTSVPVFSIKGQLGHTLGACGVLETIITTRCLQEDVILPSVGFSTPGTTATINVAKQLTKKPLTSALNLAVGFGGGNAAILLNQAN